MSNYETVVIRKATGVNVLGFRTRGGIAEVYNAVLPEGGQVILRKLRKDLRFKLRMRKRFIHGIRVRRKLGKHPNIVQYISEQGGLQPAEVIEYVPGESLKVLIVSRNRWIFEQPFEAVKQAASSLAHCHDRGFLHLDVKPENFLVQFDNGVGTLKLTDFDFSVPITTTQVPKKFGGSLLYEPPEFLSSKQVSVQTDIFALGVLAYYLFTFQMPFVNSSYDMLKRKEGEEHLVFNDSNKRISPAIKNFLSLCLHPKPEFRYGSDKVLMRGILKAEREHEKYLNDLRKRGELTNNVVFPGSM